MVPMVEGLLEEEAVHSLESVGLEVNVRYEPLPMFSPNDGRVIDQSPVANLEIDLGTTVTIVVGQAEQGGLLWAALGGVYPGGMQSVGCAYVGGRVCAVVCMCDGWWRCFCGWI